MNIRDFSVTFGALAVMQVLVIQPARGQGNSFNDFVPPTVFQAAGPTVSSIQGTVDQFRTALGANNNNDKGPIFSGHREINWDGLGSSATDKAPTPFTNFLATRGALFTTPGTGFVQAPPSGIASTFGNPAYETIFQPFSLLRLFSAIGSNVTETTFFIPVGSNNPGAGNVPATTNAFGAVFTDVDLPDGSGPGTKLGTRQASTLIEYFGVDGRLLFSSFVPASPGNGSLTFFGVKFNDSRIARVRITSGNSAPGPSDDEMHDIVMMDDFIYGEPRAIQ